MYQSKKKPSFLQNTREKESIKEEIEKSKTEEIPSLQRKAQTIAPPKKTVPPNVSRPLFSQQPPMETPPPRPIRPTVQGTPPYRPMTPPPPQQSTPPPLPPPPVRIFSPLFRQWKRRWNTRYQPITPQTHPSHLSVASKPEEQPIFRTKHSQIAKSVAAPATDTENLSANLEGEEAQDPMQSQAEFEKENPKVGVLRVETFIAGRALPVTDVNIVVTHRIGEDEVVYYNVNTNEVGIVDGLTLPAPDASTSQSPNQPNPFATYTLYATRDRYRPQGPIEIQIFDGIKTIQPLLMQWQLQEGE